MRGNWKKQKPDLYISTMLIKSSETPQILTDQLILSKQGADYARPH